MRFAAILTTCWAAIGFQDGSAHRSHDQAVELVRLMTERQLSTIAADDPAEDGRFVAAMHIPGSQLLLIRTRYAAPALLRTRIAAGDFQQIYIDLHAAGERDGRLFIMDFGADGLAADGADGTRFDISWRDALEQTMYNGKWQEQKLSEADYRKRFADQAQSYAEALGVLVTALGARTSPRLFSMLSERDS
jgi:hypothetical protein